MDCHGSNRDLLTNWTILDIMMIMDIVGYTMDNRSTGYNWVSMNGGTPIAGWFINVSNGKSHP